ncbi:MAG: NYN domain-containing protein [Phycisphaerales bacterium]|nr:MAG: NYN domain-containing protein [Phycisphaerales bacterium]
MQSFVSQLERLPRFHVRLGKLAYRGERADGSPIFVQKRVDIMLGVDLTLVASKHQISTAILVAGDSDLLPAVEIARNEGVLVHLVHGPNPHRELWDRCDERTLISQTLIDRVRRPAE